jgi:replicative DNA helicase
MVERVKSTGSRGKQKTIVVPEMGRLQPQARELEEAVLGALMLEKDAYSIVCEILKPECFYEKEHEKIYAAIVDLAVSQQPVDMLTVTEQLKRRGELEEVGGPFYISQLTSKVASSAHIEYHARIIAQKYVARELITFTATVQDKAFDETIDVEDLMQEAEGKLFEISQRNVKKDVTQINPVIKEAIDMLQIAANRKDGLSGLRTGFEGLDKMTSGWQNSDLIIIAARPAMGKTAFVLSMAKNMAVNHNIPVALFSLEMSNVQLVNRLIVNVCEIPGEKIKSGRLENYEWEQLDFKIKDLYDAPIYVDDTPSLSVFELRTKARRLVREHGIKIIIIDYLQLMNASGMNFGSREQEVSTISRSLKGLAKELNIPIIALSQLNRNSDNPVPNLNRLRDSGQIAEAADVVVFVYRPEYYGKSFPEPYENVDTVDKAMIDIAKGRNIGTSRFICNFNKKNTFFSDIAEEREEIDFNGYAPF